MNAQAFPGVVKVGDRTYGPRFARMVAAELSTSSSPVATDNARTLRKLADEAEALERPQ